MEVPFIEFKDFSFRYDSQAEPTLKQVNVTIHRGEKILVLGPSGSGKSTFGKVLNGLIPNAFEGEVSGTVTLNGESLIGQSIATLSYQVGTVLQDTSAQFVGMTVAEDVAFALENDQVQAPQLQEQVAYWLSQLNLVALAKQAPQDLSGGQKQRVSMAGVLIDQPEILLFDEPLANLDPETGYQTMALIDQLHRRLQTTIILIEHRLEDVLSQKVDRVLVFDQGQIVFDGSAADLLASNRLMQVGIREPLYVSAIHYATQTLEGFTDLDQVQQVAGQDLAIKLQAWNQQLDFPVRSQALEPLLDLQRVNFHYPLTTRQALSDFSVTINRGEMISIVGTNGAGKTTLAKIIAGFLPVSSGETYWQAEVITQDTILQRASRIGYVMQDPNQMISQHLIFDEVALGLRLRGVDEEQVRERVHEVLKICGLFAFREWPISALSYGQKKRVTIAAILVLEPTLLILDEPTAGQDYHHYHEFMQFIRALNEQGMTIVMITHDLQLMLEYTDRTIVVVDGQLLADTTPFDVLTSLELTQKASLRPTTLYRLAERMGIEDPTRFVQNFIQYERQVSEHA